jgi:hypothetical protein
MLPITAGSWYEPLVMACERITAGSYYEPAVI